MTELETDMLLGCLAVLDARIESLARAITAREPWQAIEFEHDRVRRSAEKIRKIFPRSIP